MTEEVISPRRPPTIFAILSGHTDKPPSYYFCSYSWICIAANFGQGSFFLQEGQVLSRNNPEYSAVDGSPVSTPPSKALGTWRERGTWWAGRCAQGRLLDLPGLLRPSAHVSHGYLHKIKSVSIPAPTEEGAVSSWWLVKEGKLFSSGNMAVGRLLMSH